ncbi:hypothetical protein ACVW00_001716 [Marmoricola sp. URHA0025 HA25]
MPEPTFDPIRELESFDSGGLGMTPLAPSQVRRLGDRRRSRRNAGLVAASVVAVLAAASPVALLANRGSDDHGPAPAVSTPPSPTTSATTSPTAEPPKVITYPGSGIEVVTAADAEKLTGTTAAFRSFITSQAAADGASCTATQHGVTVQKYSSAGYAIGGRTCGGYVALWVDRDGTWQEGMGTQDVWDCDTLGYLQVPTSFAGECADEAGDFGPREVSGLRLGMTEAQIVSAGGAVDPGPSDQCRSVRLPYVSPVANSTDGYYSPTHHLVGISARPGMKTPERIGLGSSVTAVRAAYPSVTHGTDLWVVPLAGDSEYEFVIDEQGIVTEMTLSAHNQDCFG